MDGVPANLKLWDLKPPGADDVGSEEREAKFEASLDTLAEELKANPEQIEATRRAFDAPIGLSLVDGMQRTGKTFAAILQALTAVSLGNRVLMCAPTNGMFEIKDMFSKHRPSMPNGKPPKAYLSVSPWLEDYQRKMLDIAEASHESDNAMPVSDENESTRLLLRTR